METFRFLSNENFERKLTNFVRSFSRISVKGIFDRNLSSELLNFIRFRGFEECSKDDLHELTNLITSHTFKLKINGNFAFLLRLAIIC